MKQESDGEGAAFRFSPRPNRAAEINWQEWEAATFRRAQIERKPVMLAISAVWCHWCHVMDEHTYSDPTVIAAINRNFIAIRVDTDRRPDVNRRYNQGGWPTVAFLTPAGELLWGATYLPPEQMRTILDRLNEYYRTNEGAISAAPGTLAQRAKSATAKVEEADLDQSILDRADKSLADNFDPAYGGFGSEPKFPFLDALLYALERYHRTADEDMAPLLRLSLDAMQQATIFDRVAGGFFRYSTTRDWGIPHFEKMLEDNVGFLRLYLDAYKVFDDARYRETALRVSGYLLETLHDSTRGVFWGSQDAEEGYYALDRAGREQRVAPYVDRTIYVDWNAQAATAYAAGYRVLGDPEFRQTALRAVDFLWENCYRPDIGLCHYWPNPADQPSLLGDQASTLLALLDAHEVSGNPAYLDQAEALAQIVKHRFQAPSGGFYDVAEAPAGDVQPPRFPIRPLIENARAAEAFWRMALMTGDGRYRVVAEQTLRAFAGANELDDLSRAAYWRAVALILQPALHIVIVGDRRHARTADLLWESLHVFSPGKVVQLITPDSPRLGALGYPPEPSPVAYICRGTTCLPPITDAKAIAPQVLKNQGAQF